MKVPFAASLLLSVVVLTGGCSFLKSNAGAEQTYVLRAAPPVAASTPVPVTLQMLRPSVEPGLDSMRIALVRPGNRLDYYAKARWSGPLADVVHSLAAQSLRASGAFASVDTDRGGFGAQSVLAITVRRFEAEYGADEMAPPTAHVRFECTLGDRLDRHTIANFDVEVAVPATENRLGPVVVALERAANQALAQLTEKTAAALAQAQKVDRPVPSIAR